MALGFRFVHRMSGAQPTIRNIVSADTTLHEGDMVNLEGSAAARVADLAVTNDTKLVGVVIGPGDADNGDGGTLTLDGSADTVRVVVDEDAVYAVTDANARDFGDTLDLSGGTGAQTVTTSSNADFIVVADSTASEPTLVMLSQANHVLASS